MLSTLILYLFCSDGTLNTSGTVPKPSSGRRHLGNWNHSHNPLSRMDCSRFYLEELYLNTNVCVIWPRIYSVSSLVLSQGESHMWIIEQTNEWKHSVHVEVLFSLLVLVKSPVEHTQTYPGTCKNGVSSAHHQSSTKHLPRIFNLSASRASIPPIHAQSKTLRLLCLRWDLCAQIVATLYSSLLACVLLSTLPLMLRTHPNTCSLVLISMQCNCHHCREVCRHRPSHKPYGECVICVNKFNTCAVWVKEHMWTIS